MAGYAPKRFSGRSDEDIDEFVKDFRLYLTAANINTGNAAGKQRALELFRSCLTGEASRWVEDRLIGKKWRLDHVRCGNALANMAAVVALNNANITAAMINAPDGTLPPALPAGATGATVIPAHNVHADEDWSLAGGCPVDAGTATNAPNGALNNNNHIVLPDINISQVIYWFKRNYPTVVREQQQMVFGTLRQGYDSVRDYYRKIDKYARWGGISDREKRIQFIRGLSPENKLEMKRLGLNRPLNDELIENLEQIEVDKNDMLLGEDIYNQPATKIKPKESPSRGITTEDVDRIVNSRIQALQRGPQLQTSQPTRTDLQAQPTRIDLQAQPTRTDLQDAIKMLVDAMKSSRRTLAKKPGPARKKADDIRVDRFLRDEVEKMNLDDNYDDNYDYDPVEEMRRELEEFHINKAKIINAVKKLAKAKYRCSNCDKSGHNSRNCPKKKKKRRRVSKRGKVHLVVDDSDTNSDGGSSSSGESETESSSASEGEISVNIAKQSFISVDTIRKIIQSEIGVALQEEINKILSSLPSYTTQTRPVGTSPLDTKKQDRQDRQDRRDSSQNKSISSTNTIPVPMDPESGPSDSDDEDEYLDDSMEIDFVQKKEPKTSIASVKCKIKRLKIPAMALDSAAEIPIITEDIVKRVKADIDKSIKHDLSGIATATIESIGVVHNLPITLSPGCTIHEDFVVVKYPKPMLIFANPLLKKYRCAIDWDKNELKIPHNGKDLIIPVTMHKVKNKIEVNCASVASPAPLQGRVDKSIIPDCVSQDADDILKKNMIHARPEEHIKELEVKLYATLKSNAELNDLCERMQAHHSKQLGK
ncbi:unnamed protein product [Rhizophagus irregularis]|nr:unnamed protein product [Rhizophagus irregularis]